MLPVLCDLKVHDYTVNGSGWASHRSVITLSSTVLMRGACAHQVESIGWTCATARLSFELQMQFSPCVLCANDTDTSLNNIV